MRTSRSKSKLTQSQTTESSTKRNDSKMSCNGKKQKKDQNQWVIIAPDKAIQVDDNDTEDPVFVQLLHPKTDLGAMFMLNSDGTLIYEVTAFKENFRSWFINQTVQQDGSIKMVTPVDPLFLVLPYLRKSDKQMNKFMTLDQIVIDDNYPQCHRLVNCSGLSNLEHCCDVKGDDDLKVYRYNNKKTLSWLQTKVERTATTLEENSIHCAAGSQSATFVRSSKGKETSRDDYVRYAAGLISDYLHPDLSKELIQFMGIKEAEKKKESTQNDEKSSEPPAKKAKVAKGSSGSEPEEDYSKYFADKKDKPKAASKLTSGQKALSKVDKTGMRSIASFFSKGAKKK
ncbi:ribonuclease H2 subunit B-like [Amphiura filiformis]|uniref:ribonuclease H2 subunit B-like n=1 Tax=Amphiura filiformis TaxID=82378 RepID=UPI003B21B0DA